MPSAVRPAAFSRLQLAAALVEYDNDPSNPEVPFRSAHESAIFSHLRRHEGISRPRRSVDYLGVAVPSETESDSGRRKSRGSIGVLRNPFGTADDEDEPSEDVGMEVDLTSWGLDAFMEKGKYKGKGKQKSEALPNPHSSLSPRNDQIISDNTPRHGDRGARSMSVGTLNDFGVGGAFLDAEGAKVDTIDRFRSSLDLDELQRPQVPPQRRRASIHALIETLPVQPPLHSVPFPSVSVSGRSSSPGPEETLRPGSRGSRLNLQPSHDRTRSNASLSSQIQLNDGTDDDKINGSSVRSHTPEHISRFDSQVNRVRSMSNATMGTMASKNVLADENPFSLRPPSPSRSSRFDPKARTRTMSVNSMGTRALLENGPDAELRRDRPYSTIELLRPKVLVMPSPLQSVAPTPLPPTMKPRSGFSTSTDGPPLPPGARSARPPSNFELPSVPIASNSFTPNPRASLSLSQLAFRNALLVGGQRDIAYSDIDRHLPCAEQEGEQARFDDGENEEVSPVPTSVPLPTVPPPTEVEIRRPAGKLYGWSLIDNLEHRKAEMKQKARTFQGDDRPSMMFRGQIRRSSTLIDPAAIGASLPSSNLNGPQAQAPTLNKYNPENGRLVVDNSDEKLFSALGTSVSAPNMKSRSVFGVDTLWDREMAKLKELEALERAEAEEQRKRDQEEAGRHERKKKKGKSKRKVNRTPPRPEDTPSRTNLLGSRVSSEPPTLPAIQKPVLGRAPVVDTAEESESESGDDSVPLGHAVGRSVERAADSWVAESSDEDDGPRRRTGVGPRYPVKAASSTPQIPPLSNDDNDDSEEDLPLIAAAERVAKRATHLPPPRLIDEDEDKPLAAVINEGRKSLPSLSFDNLSRTHHGMDNDDDDRPLGLRISRAPMASQTSLAFAGEDDDDKPLAFHPEQQRRIQHQLHAQAQQQQHMMMQAQMHNSIYFGASAMFGSGLFGPPMGTVVGMPVAPPSPPPVQDAVKFGRVDKWRRDVAVEGEH